VGIIVIFEQKLKYGPMDFFGCRCMKILKGMSPHAPNVNGLEAYLKRMLCP
jgi:hypothetical protein